MEVKGTPLEAQPALYRQRDRRVWRDGDLFRALVLHNYGGVYVDMDMVLLRSIGVLLEQEFVYQWENYDGVYNGALMYLRKGSAFARELLCGIIEIPPGDSNWGRANFRRAFDRGVRVTVFPAPFFDTEWQADLQFEPFRKTPNSAAHNRWDQPIQEGSKFQLLEARIHRLLTVRGFLT